mmetsp:Transcript_20163/g.29983  ORF Transcript_20163/g.29983 Transcript_20163/m.29983 type:complete len:253 (-) Transcript_20163:35-793(-)|eukprot:CAMPEP_0201544836 /NCGR_PEP_ID=MMETSP0173_2-20130828/1452_1 /ASSEMBLY_ACC=CAM_ASM_000268 /TAXON_ID=218659 /ORGANISM="Vexillifera sp., Strain DIVA3 564/2" /LENGTH=252 /DNA_ID=CAMNT_0047953099 /DNA_START=140 /DNA_END=898 /DNA_ORIENTATION=-
MSSSNCLSLLEQAKKLAAETAVKRYVTKSGLTVGIGSGSTVPYAVDMLKEMTNQDASFQVYCIPTSFQAKQLILEAGLTLSSINQRDQLDVAIDGADEVDQSLNCIKGGGGCQLVEKIVASNAKRFVIIADYRKQSKTLGTGNWQKGIPLEVVPSCYVAVKRKIEAIGNVKVSLRMATAKCGPVVTDQANFILDAVFDPSLTENSQSLLTLNQRLLEIPGLVETGLFLSQSIAPHVVAIFGQKDGSVVIQEK